jgi:hypothetical protein
VVETDDAHTEAVPFTEAELDRIREANEAEQWGLDVCGFPSIWTELDGADDFKPIGMIDIGNHRGHPELRDRIEYVGPTNGQDSIADHASAVASIICARRDDDGIGDESMKGCCSAKIVLYNVWTRHDGLDVDALCAALRNAIDRKLPGAKRECFRDALHQGKAICPSQPVADVRRMHLVHIERDNVAGRRIIFLVDPVPFQETGNKVVRMGSNVIRGRESCDFLTGRGRLPGDSGQ